MPYVTKWPFGVISTTDVPRSSSWRGSSFSTRLSTMPGGASSIAMILAVPWNAIVAGGTRIHGRNGTRLAAGTVTEMLGFSRRWRVFQASASVLK